MMIVALLATFIGIFLGLLGGGGSILTVPLLSEVADLPAKQAIAASLFVVATTSVLAAVAHARSGNVDWRAAGLFGAASMAGAFSGARVAAVIPGVLLLILFAVVMLATSIGMLRRKGACKEGGTRRLKPGLAVLEGAGVGFFTGMVGAGGGFLVVPALALLGGLSMRKAIGTSLVIIAMKSYAAFAGYLSHVDIPWTLTLMVTATALVGAVVGERLAKRVPAVVLQKGFAWFVLATGVWMIFGRFL